MQVPALVKDLVERAVKTAAQTALTVLGADQLNLLNVDWETVVGLSGGAALLSVLTSLASSPRVGTLSPASAVKQ
jgi:ABC-type lipoprotein release transport system permease subunit